MKTRLVFLLIACGMPVVTNAREWKVPEDVGSIQKAIDQTNPGDIISVAPGVYRERLNLRPGVTLRSRGDDAAGKLGLKRAESTVIDGGGDAGEDSGVELAEGSILDGFTITNVGKYDEAKWQEAWDKHGNNQAHEHIGLFGVPGIAVTGVNAIVINNIVHHIGDTGIAVRGERDKRSAPLISGNVCYRNMGGGIGAMKGTAAVIDSNICFENFYAGIGHNHSYPLITRNECYRNVRAGIGVSEGACPVVRSNRCYQNRRAGIGIRTGSDTRPVIEDNDCYENELSGIGSDEEAAPVIRNNRCYQNKRAGIGCQNDANPIIEGNHCYENNAAGIGLSSATAFIRKNRCEKNKAAGIAISGKDSSAVLIANICEENRLIAVGVPDGATAVLQGNTFARTGGMPPIVAILGGSKVTLIENTIKGGGIGAIMLDGELTAINNTITGRKGGSGIVIRENGHAVLKGNKITGYRKTVNNPDKARVID